MHTTRAQQHGQTLFRLSQPTIHRFVKLVVAHQRDDLVGIGAATTVKTQRASFFERATLLVRRRNRSEG
jgi:hypothetical protein